MVCQGVKRAEAVTNETAIVIEEDQKWPDIVWPLLQLLGGRLTCEIFNGLDTGWGMGWILYSST